MEITKNAFVGSKMATAKAEFEARLSSINATVANAVLQGQMQSVDYALYVTRAMGAESTVDLFKSGDAEEVGLTNISKRQLEANTYMLVTHIQLLSAVGTAHDDDALKAAAYGQITNLIANGEFELKSNATVLIPRVSNEVFRQPAGNGKLAGDWQLECPKMLVPLTNIDAKIYTLTACPDHTMIKLVLHGVKTHRAYARANLTKPTEIPEPQSDIVVAVWVSFKKLILKIREELAKNKRTKCFTQFHHRLTR